jgi:aryl-alcohol dehydrogenase-like predicted oxidoreductase
VLDAQAAAGQPGARVALRRFGDAEALRVLRGGDEAVVARARAIEEAAQERVLGGGMRMGEDEPEAQALGGRRRADTRRLGHRAWDVGHQDPIGRGGARRRGERGEQQECPDDFSHARLNEPKVGNLLGLRARYVACVRNIPGTNLAVHPLCLGTNVFGWTADEAESFAVLDAYRAAGGNFVDTADGYSQWVPGNRGGESEEIIGRWMARRGSRDAIVVATKVGSKSDRKGLTAENVRVATEESLRRLQTDRIDLLYTHRDDEVTPPEETLVELDALVREGKVRHVAASNVSPERLEAAMQASEREGLVRYVALQPHYNLVERGYENGLADVCRRHDLGCLPYFALAKGFLTGKYRPGADVVRSERAQGAGAYLDERGERVLAALDAAAAAHDVPVAATSLAWLAARPTVVSPIASARTPAQLAELMAMTDLQLSADELRALDDASA